MLQLFAEETVADEEGRFRFENLMTNAAAVYSVEADFDDVRYGSNFFEFGADSQLETADVTVYAAGADASAINTPPVKLSYACTTPTSFGSTPAIR